VYVALSLFLSLSLGYQCNTLDRVCSFGARLTILDMLISTFVCVAKEDRELQLAMEASLKSASQMDVDQSAGFGLSADEMYISPPNARVLPNGSSERGCVHLLTPSDPLIRQIQQAVERSLLESGVGSDAMSLVSNNPNHRKREEGLPVGLRNVGNTCYFNSLLQARFTKGSLRVLISSACFLTPGPPIRTYRRTSTSPACAKPSCRSLRTRPPSIQRRLPPSSVRDSGAPTHRLSPALSLSLSC
jgi:hypothetical protein